MSLDIETSMKSTQDIHALYTSKKISCTELTKQSLQKISQDDLGIFLRSCETLALETAQKVDDKINTGEKLGPLEGIPIAVKDNILIKDHICSAGSQFLKNHIAQYSSTVVDKLLKNNCIIVGQTNMDEFAMGSSNENSSYYPCKNPVNPDYVPGGSSGGSAAAVAANLSCLSLGTDTGGSVRQPASFCGISALKPTYGRTSRYGVIAFASSLDQVGPMAHNVYDLAACYENISSFDVNDSKSYNKPIQASLEQLKNSSKDLKGKTIAYCPEFFPEGVEDVVKDNFQNSIDIAKKLGANVIEVDLPHIDLGVACYYVLAPAEASSNLARFDGIRFTEQSSNNSNIDELIAHSRAEYFGDEVCRRILMGTFVLSSGFYDAYYTKALSVQKKIQDDFAKAFEQADFILTPTAPSSAFKIGEHAKDPLKLYLADLYTVPASIAGLPALSIPSGVNPTNNMPIGLQLIANYYQESALFDCAQAFEHNFKINNA